MRMDNNAVSWLHRSNDPSGQPARWIEVIDTYDIIFQHRSGQKHGNTDALSRYPCHQCGGECERAPQAIQYLYQPGWAAEDDRLPRCGANQAEKAAGEDRHTWEDISPELQDT